jgi:hypothetical protein
MKNSEVIRTYIKELEKSLYHLKVAKDYILMDIVDDSIYYQVQEDLSDYVDDLRDQMFLMIDAEQLEEDKLTEEFGEATGDSLFT